MRRVRKIIRAKYYQLIYSFGQKCHTGTELLKAMKRSKKGSSFESKVKKAILILCLLYVGQGIVKGMFSTHTIVLHAKAQIEEPETGDVCGLDTVVCSDTRGSRKNEDSELQSNGQDGIFANENQAGGAERPAKASSPSIESLIRETFPERPEEALRIFQCESGYNPEAIGDEHITFMHNGQKYGRSIGIAQIRTGGIEKNGKTWTRSDNAEQFEAQMKNPAENLKWARKIYNGQGWYAWLNCAKKTGIIQ